MNPCPICREEIWWDIVMTDYGYEVHGRCLKEGRYPLRWWYVRNVWLVFWWCFPYILCYVIITTLRP